MSGIDTATGVLYASGQPYYDHVLTNWFLKRFPDARNNSSVLLSMLEKRPEESVGGRYIIFPVRYGRNTGVGNLGWGAYMPDPTAQSATSMLTLTRQGMARIKIDGPTLRKSSKQGSSYFDSVQMEMQGVMDDVEVDRARQVHNDGSGRLAEVKSISTTTITLKVNSFVEGAATTRAADTLDATGWLDVGQRVAFITNGGTIHDGGQTPQTSFYIIAIAQSGNDVTIQVSLTLGGAAVDLTSSVAVAANDWVVRGHRDALSSDTKNTSYRREIMGLAGIFSDAGPLDGVGASAAQQATSASSENYTQTSSSTFQGCAMTGAKSWNAGIVLDNSGSGNRPMTLALLQKALSDSERINNANVTTMLSAYQAYDAYYALLDPDKRYVNTMELKGGHRVLSFNEIPWVKDRFCYQNRVYFLGLDQIEMLETAPLQPIGTGDITTWQMSNFDKDEYWRGWVWEDQIAVTGIRNRCGSVLVELSA